MCYDTAAPLLRRGRECDTVSLLPLYATTFLRTSGFAMATLPALALRMYSLTRASGGDASSAAWSLGVAASLRYISEFVGSQLLLSWSWTLGCRSVLLLSCAAMVLETSLMAGASTPMTLGLVHVLGGLAYSAGAIENQCILDMRLGRARKEEVRDRLLFTMGTALAVSPCLAGAVAMRYGGQACYHGAFIAGLLAIAVVQFVLPESPQKRRKVAAKPCCQGLACRSAGSVDTSREFAWYCCAMALSATGMAAFGSTSVLWMKVSLRWAVLDVGDFITVGSVCQMIARLVILPAVVQKDGGYRPFAAQLCLGVTALRFVALCAFNGSSIHSVLAVIVATMPGFCSTPFLATLCLTHAPMGEQGFWSFGLPAMNGAASAVGSLVGAILMARALSATDSLYGHLSPEAPLLFTASMHVLACICVAHAKKAGKQVVDLDV